MISTGIMTLQIQAVHSFIMVAVGAITTALHHVKNVNNVVQPYLPMSQLFPLKRQVSLEL